MRPISRHNQKTDTTTQLYCTLSMYITPKTIPCQNQKTNTTPQLYCTLSTSTKVCKTKTYFPPEPKTDTTAQLEKSSSSPRAASVIVIQAKRGFTTMYFLCQVVDEEFHVGFHRRLSVRMINAFNADYCCKPLIIVPYICTFGMPD